jgi:tRNA-uridine 2-sulfurtransferase
MSSNANRKVRAIGLLSGGLDSTLAHALVKSLGVEVKAVNFYTGFCILETQRRLGRTRPDGSAPRNDALSAAASLETEIEFVDISGPEYLQVITRPRYGYGANANPCVDCRIFMFRRAKEIMDREGADFVFTGEVLGQRPKSQRRDPMRTIEVESGLEGRVLRPLSARLLEPTIPEREGLIEREKLLDISGRSRKRQMELAQQMGIADYPQPAGGCCFLTDETFGRRFHDLVNSRPDRHIDQDEVPMLATGRHFRLSPKAKLIVGRNEGENALLSTGAGARFRLEARGLMGPVGLVEGEPGDEERALASRIVARYGKGKDLPEVGVEWCKGEERWEIRVEPFRDDAAFEGYRI